MNDLRDLEPNSLELSDKLNELALKFNIPPSILREAMLQETKELLDQQTRKGTSWIWKSLELFNGPEGVKDILINKWNNINIVCTLLMTITVPMGLSPPQSLYSNSDPDYIYSWFQCFMFVSSSCSMMGILSNAFWIDSIQTFCPRPSDIVFYVNCGTFDVPLQMMIGAILTAIAGFVALMKTNSTPRVFNFCIAFGTIITAYFIYQFQKLGIPLLCRQAEFLRPFQNASKWSNITEELLQQEDARARAAQQAAEKLRQSIRLSRGRANSSSSSIRDEGPSLGKDGVKEIGKDFKIESGSRPTKLNPLHVLSREVE